MGGGGLVGGGNGVGEWGGIGRGETDVRVERGCGV